MTDILLLLNPQVESPLHGEHADTWKVGKAEDDNPAFPEE